MVPVIPDDLTTLSASKAAKLIAARAISSLDLVGALLNRVEEWEAAIQAWAFLDPDQVRKQAKIRDSSRPSGPLHGVPIGIKDVIATADQPTAFNSPIYAHHQPNDDASCIRSLRDAGAIIMGKTVTSEFAFRKPGPTRNPHDPLRTPGGSSSGSAAAVAACMVPAALATQTGGSTIRPAAYCGIFGYKPGFGTYDTRGLKYLAPSLDTIGIMARDLEDISLISAVLTGAPSISLATPSKPSRIALFQTPYADQADASAISCLEDIARRASAAGVRVRRLDAPDWMSCLDQVHSMIMAGEAARSLAFEWNNRRFDLSPEISQFIVDGHSYSEHDIANGRANIARARRWYIQNVQREELVLTFATTGEAPRGDSNTGSAVFNRLWSGTDSACLSLPAGRGMQSMPVAVQLVDISGDESNLLRKAQWFVSELQLGPT